MRRIALFLVTLSLIASQGYSQELPFGSVATSDDCRAVFLNPAGLVVKREANGILSFSSKDEGLEDVRFALGTKAGGFGYQSRDDLNSYISAVGFEIGHRVSLGLRPKWTKTKQTSYFSLDLGLLYRPNNFLSLGLVGNSLNQPKEIKREYLAGAALRPLTDRVTIFAEGELQEAEKLKDASYRLGAEIEPLDGIIIGGSLDNDRNFSLGVTLRFPTFGIGSSANFDSDGVSRKGFELSFSKERFRTALLKRDKIAQITLEGLMEDEARGFSLFGGSSKSANKIIEQLEKAKDDQEVRGILLWVKSFRAGLATVQELREKIIEVRKEDKKVVAYLETGGGDHTFCLASAADKIIVAPSGFCAVLGRRAEIQMLKRLLDKLGMEADLVRSGKYKSAVEPLTREELSEEAREEYKALIDDFYRQATERIAQGRNLTPEKMEAIVEQGPMWAEQAKEAGLIDEIGYYDEAKSLIAKLCDLPSDPDKVRLVNLEKRRYRSYQWIEPPKVAVIQASGAIVTGKSRTDKISGTKYLGADTLIEQIKKARSDKSIKAIVLRVDSPGGDGIASDLIWKEIEKTRDKKPVVVSMGDLAASGGYYISVPADKIVTNPGTITGSIGCFSGKLVLEGTYDKIGVSPEVIKKGEHADMFSSSRRFTEEEREIMQSLNDYFYNQFLDRVVHGRGMELEEVERIAQGRIYTGNQAKKCGLVDQLGTLSDAIDLASKLAKIEGKPKVVYIKPEKPSALELLRLLEK